METRIERVLADDDTATLALHGEIDFSNADDVAQAIRDAIAEWSPAEVRVDLRGATFIDSTGLGALIEGYRAATEAECRFVVTNPSDNFRRVLTLTGLCDLFGLGERDEPAGNSFSSASATGARLETTPAGGRRGPSTDSAPGGSSRITLGDRGGRNHRESW